jgi:putative membrane protein
MRKYFLGLAVFWAVNMSVAASLAQEAERYYSGHMNMGWGGWVLGPIMMVFWLAVSVAVIVLVVRALGGIMHHSPSAASGNSALDILKERFARGDITKQEFEEAKKLIED